MNARKRFVEPCVRNLTLRVRVLKTNVLCMASSNFKVYNSDLLAYQGYFIFTDLGERDDISNPTKGILLVYGEGKWGTVCAEANVTTEIGEVICNSLQLGKFVRTQNYLDSDFAKDAEETITRSWLKAGIQPINENFYCRPSSECP